MGRKEREQKREGRGESGEGGSGKKGRQREKRRARTDSRVWHSAGAGTLASIQALVCVGRGTIDAD